MALHPTQIELLELLKQHIEDPLTVRELMDELGLSSPNLVHHHIVQLEKKGYLKRNPSNPRDYKLLVEPEKPVTHVNMYGLAKCGPEGTLLSGDPVDRIPISSQLIPFPVEDAFMVTAEGNSMEPMIREGDIVIARQQSAAETGDVVICSYDGRVMIKRLRKFTNRIMLDSLNPEIEPLFIEDVSQLHIEGVFKGLIRRSV